jgi:succinylglutamic semialdehyde dehydrogenase
LVPGGKEAGLALVGHPQLDGLLFTGSASTGRWIHQRFGGRPEAIVALEMGGNNPLVVDTVEDVDAAVLIVLQSAYLTAGQRCTCARRLFVPRSPFGRSLIDRLVEVTGNLRIGRFDSEPPPFMGPVISEQAADALLDAQARMMGLGGNPLLRMRKLEEGTGLVSPGLIDMTGVSGFPDEEHFGPLLQLHFYDRFDEALARANATRFGLAAGLISEDRAKWQAFVDRIRAGVINWNRPLTGASSAAPFGGVGASGNHRPSAYNAADYCAYPVASLEQDTVTRPDTVPPGVTL